MSSEILILHAATNTIGDASQSWLSQVMLYKLKVDAWPPKVSLPPAFLIIRWVIRGHSSVHRSAAAKTAAGSGEELGASNPCSLDAEAGAATKLLTSATLQQKCFGVGGLSLSFLSFLLGKTQGKKQNKVFYLHRSPQILGNEEKKRSKKKEKSLPKTNQKKRKSTKTRKGRTR